jgi:hypothetical protein
MKKNIIITLLSAILVITTVLIVAQDRRDDQGGVPEQQVTSSIQTFTRLVNDQNIQSFGLKSVDQLRSLKPGRQFRKYMIGLDDVKKFKSGDDANAIIKPLEAVEVSLVDASGAIQTSIEFVRKDNKWEPSGYGLSQDLTRVRNVQREIPDSIFNSSRLISIPALRTSFLAVGAGAALNFVVLEDNAQLDLKRGAIIPASDAVLRLVSSANEYNGLPD